MAICSIKRTSTAICAMSDTSPCFGLTINPLKSEQWTSLHRHTPATFYMSAKMFPNPYLYLFSGPLPPLTPPSNDTPQPSEHPIPIHPATCFSIRTKYHMVQLPSFYSD